MPQRATSARASVRPVIESVRPVVDAGRFPAKGTRGSECPIEADAFVDGHDLLHCEAVIEPPDADTSQHLQMLPVGNDRFATSFVPDTIGLYRFSVRARVDRFASWLGGYRAKRDAGLDLDAEHGEGLALLEQAARRARGEDQASLSKLAEALIQGDLESFDTSALELIGTYLDRDEVRSDSYQILVERELAGCSTWYELFPRSWGEQHRHGRFGDVIDRLDYIERLGADVLYLPPIHPIGTTNRKGKNGTREATPSDPGSPWAIGDRSGGHTAVHKELGTIAEFDALVEAANERGIEIALDLAFQCSPDHPWVSEHPSWFRHRSDGSIAHAENPPKRYEDVVPFDFETTDWPDLWDALLLVVEFWIDHGVKVFRVDNPHTKPFGFWEWLLKQVRAEHPEVIFLSEAFTRPKVMYRLAKLGFSQSYTYFAWRNEKNELESYVRELTSPPVVDFFRPSLWPNTPDILTETLQRGGRGAFISRLVLAATMSANYGIYGAAFELGYHRAREAGSEEYEGSEKYEIVSYDLERNDSLAPLVERVNAIRRRYACLRQDRTLSFHYCDNSQIIAYSKRATSAPLGERSGAPVLVVVNLDPFHPQSGWVHLDTSALGVEPGPLVVHDLLTNASYEWSANQNFVMLDPQSVPAHVFEVSGAGTP